jgi:GxxExxY protein
MGSYQPDFIVEDKIIIELKALEQMPHKMIDQLYSYLRNSIYELGFLINFSSDGAAIKRIIYTNDKKKHLQPQTESQC